MDEAEQQQPSAPLHEAFRQNVGRYLDALDRIRGRGLDKSVLSRELPKIVAIGDQSAGKSTVIENLAGIRLPRGKGTVTRCPLELRLRQADETATWAATIEYGEKKKRVIDPTSVPNAISKAQQEITGDDSTVSDEVIVLTVEDPHLPYSLTVIDLPGIIQIGVGDQSEEDVARIQQLAESYIKSPECIVLVTISADQDFQVSTKALKLAQDFDTEQKRTLCVLTKADLVKEDEYDRVMEALDGKLRKLAKGYHIVFCRNDHAKRDDDEGFVTKFDGEETFFQRHEKFRKIPAKQRGVKQLAIKLSAELSAAIKGSFEQIRREFIDKGSQLRERVEKLTREIPLEGETLKRVLKMLYEYLHLTDKMFAGDYNERHGRDPLPVECRVHVSYNELLHRFDETAQDKLAEITNPKLVEFIREELRSFRGPEMAGFSNYHFFVYLVRLQLDLYRQPAEDFLSNLARRLEECLCGLMELQLEEFTDVLAHLKDVIYRLMHENLENGRKKLHELFEEESTSMKGANELFSRKFNELAEMALDPENRGKSLLDQLGVEGKETFFTMFPVTGAFKEMLLAQIVYHAATYLASKAGKGDGSGLTADDQEARHTRLRLCTYFEIAHQRLLATIPMRIQFNVIEEFKGYLKEGILAEATKKTLVDIIRKDVKYKEERLEELKRELADVEEAGSELRAVFIS